MKYICINSMWFCAIRFVDIKCIQNHLYHYLPSICSVHDKRNVSPDTTLPVVRMQAIMPHNILYMITLVNACVVCGQSLGLDPWDTKSSAWPVIDQRQGCRQRKGHDHVTVWLDYSRAWGEEVVVGLSKVKSYGQARSCAIGEGRKTEDSQRSLLSYYKFIIILHC